MPITDTIEFLGTAALTRNVELLEESPGLFRGLLTGSTERHETEQVEWGITRRSRGTVPYVPVMAEGQFIRDRTRHLRSLRGVNITLQHAIKPGDLYAHRDIGQTIFPGGVQGRNRLLERITEYQADARMRMETNHEWFLSQLIRGQVSYSDEAYDSWIYETGRAATHDIVLSDLWTGTAANPSQDLEIPKRLAADTAFVNITLGVCSPEAAAAIRTNEKILKMLDTRNLNEEGRRSYLDNTQGYMQQGAVTYIGRLNGIELWEYNRKIDAFGTLTPMVRAGYIEFFPPTGQLDLRKHIFPIMDMEMNNGAPTPVEFFSKSWEVKHPSQVRLITQTRVVDMIHVPDAVVSVKVA